MRDALSILDMCLGYSTDVDENLVHNVLGTADKAFLFTFSEALQQADVARAFALIDQLMRDGREPIVFSRDLSQHLRCLLMAMYCSKDLPTLLELTQEDAEAYGQQATGFSSERLMRILDIYMSVETSMRYAASPRLALETATVRACTQTSDMDYTAMNERIAEMEHKLREMEKQLAEGVPASPRKSEGKGAAKAQSQTERVIPPVERVATGAEKDVWNAAVEYTKRAVPAKYALLMQGRFTGTQGDQYIWEVGAGKTNLVTMMNLEANRKMMADALSEAAGKPCQFLAVEEGTQIPEPEEKKKEEGFLDILRETFGAEHVTVQDRPK